MRSIVDGTTWWEEGLVSSGEMRNTGEDTFTTVEIIGRVRRV